MTVALTLANPKTSLFLVSEVAFYNGVIPFFVLLLISLNGDEARAWNFGAVTGVGRHQNLLIVLLAVGIIVGKLFDRLSKFLTISLTSSLFFSTLDVFRRILTAVCAWFGRCRTSLHRGVSVHGGEPSSLP